MDQHGRRGLRTLGTLFVIMVVVGLCIGFVQYTQGMLATREQIRLEAGRCDPDRDCTQKDLIAQVRAATAAEVMADVGLWSLVLSGLGFAAVGATLVVNLRATKAAISAAEAAQESAVITERTAKQQLRAYVTVGTKPIEGIIAGRQPKVGVILKNVGQTPAYNVTVLMWAQLADGKQQISIPGMEDVGEREHLILAGDGMERSAFADFSLTRHGLGDWEKGALSIFLAGIVVYQDIFGEEHKTRFTHYYPGPKGEGRYHGIGHSAD